MWSIILALLILGFVLLVVEGFVPGMVVGIAGALSVITATVLAYRQYGIGVGNLLLLVVLIGGAAFTLWWLRYAPRSRFARRWTLHTTVGSSKNGEESAVFGMEGEALSPLRPAGIADIGGRRLDVVTEGDLVASGTRIRVVKVEGNRIVVRKQDVQRELSA
jgi:membrane-bound serine protease (ClpP class)